MADPFNLGAVAGVFRAKGRETQRALPLLVADIIMAEEYASGSEQPLLHSGAGGSGRGRSLSSSRLPPGLPLKVTGNTGRLALRQSRSKVANQLVALLNQPLIATSANVSGSPTCRSGIETFGTMDGRVDLVLDGGSCSGEGATTVDITEPYWKVIRAGAIDEKEIAECLQLA